MLGWWVLFGIFLTGQNLLYSASQGGTSILAALTRAFVGAATWAVITLVAFVLSRRFPLDRSRRQWVSIGVHIVAGPALATFEVLVAYAMGRLSNEPGTLNELFFTTFPTSFLMYWLLVAVGHGLEYYRRYRRREQHAARLRARLARAELHLLKNQLHPHFLFNTLHAISALMHKDVKAADRMLARLSELLRATLDHTGTQEVRLQEELEFLEPYLEIERARLGDRLQVDLDVDPALLGSFVPHMILQPLVENAIRHGIAPRSQPGRVRVSAHARGPRLVLEVSDNGPGAPPGRSLQSGLGLSNTRARLEQLYGDDFLFEPGNQPGGGFQVVLEIPLREAQLESLHKGD